VRPGLQEPAAAARMAATLDRISDGRLLINVVTGGDPVEWREDHPAVLDPKVAALVGHGLAGEQVAPDVQELVRHLVAVRPGLQEPAAAARMAATLDRISDGRLLINVDPKVAALVGHGLAGEQVAPDVQELVRHRVALVVGLYFGGSSETGIAVAAEHCDVYLTWGEPPALVAEKLAAAPKYSGG
jgi:alkanesulfonate monooxygenase